MKVAKSGFTVPPALLTAQAQAFSSAAAAEHGQAVIAPTDTPALPDVEAVIVEPPVVAGVVDTPPWEGVVMPKSLNIKFSGEVHAKMNWLINYALPKSSNQKLIDACLLPYVDALIAEHYKPAK